MHKLFVVLGTIFFSIGFFGKRYGFNVDEVFMLTVSVLLIQIGYLLVAWPKD